MTNLLNTADQVSAISSPTIDLRRSVQAPCPSFGRSKRYVFDLNAEDPHLHSSYRNYSEDKPSKERGERIHPADREFAAAARQAISLQFEKAARLNEYVKASMQFRVVSRSGKIRLVNQVLTPLTPHSQKNHKVSVVETDLSQIAKNPVKAVRIIKDGDTHNAMILKLSGFDSDLDGCPFSGRQIQVLRLLAEGSTTTEISKSLFISADTVRTHRQHILQRSDHSNMTSTVVDCVRKGWI